MLFIIYYKMILWQKFGAPTYIKYIYIYIYSYKKSQSYKLILSFQRWGNSNALFFGKYWVKWSSKFCQCMHHIAHMARIVFAFQECGVYLISCRKLSQWPILTSDLKKKNMWNITSVCPMKTFPMVGSWFCAHIINFNLI